MATRCCRRRFDDVRPSPLASEINVEMKKVDEKPRLENANRVLSEKHCPKLNAQNIVDGGEQIQKGDDEGERAQRNGGEGEHTAKQRSAH